MIKRIFRKYAPPGFDSYGLFRKIWIYGLLLSLLPVLWGWGRLVYYRELWPFFISYGEDYEIFFESCFAGFWIFSLVPLFMSLFHYRYLTGESRADYRLKCLPGKGEYEKRLFVLPAVGCVLVLLTMVVVLWLNFLLFALLFYSSDAMWELNAVWRALI